ncbi:restriction endonuclease subunit S [Endozoicomonas sp. GU-1]|uniref:restriction endonuclease subunit S n=1 Tax=Endozoicomonas sp. GU-1 TaxID=3009078 RepID=UPI0022B546FA|nr:restriction endonuclease subunit S [Endozoicomonas sp. GU-1]WBA79765.1 restriction endonuclease subunit S [Endozoicomonas sp. GU-1]WBA87347.1 restriction endonuclease subunit S [Endozoicomonas sp. GU-1]
MKYHLKQLAQIKSGYPFRGSIKEVINGSVLVVQIRNIKPEATGIEWSNLICTELTGRKQPDWLMDGDVLFVMRGQNNIAVCLQNTPEQTISSPHFFHLRVNNPETLLPEFLAWQINQQQSQRYLQMGSVGTAQTSIRRGVLEAMEIVVPSIARQKSVLALAETARQERQLYHCLIANRSQQLQQVASELLNNPESTQGENDND